MERKRLERWQNPARTEKEIERLKKNQRLFYWPKLYFSWAVLEGVNYGCRKWRK
jgi:hypothetical protein